MDRRMAQQAAAVRPGASQSSRINSFAIYKFSKRQRIAVSMLLVAEPAILFLHNLMNDACQLTPSV